MAVTETADMETAGAARFGDSVASRALGRAPASNAPTTNALNAHASKKSPGSLRGPLT